MNHQLPKPRYAVTDPGEKHKYHIQHPDRGLLGPLRSVTKISGGLEKPALIAWAAREASNYFKTEILRLGSKALSPENLDRIAEDAKNAHRRIAKTAADLGTACHNAFEAIMEGREPESVPPELVEPIKDFKRWRLATDIEHVASELVVGSARLLFGGRLDAVGYSKERGGFVLIDYKTASGFYGNEFAYQTGGYALAFEEQYGAPIAAIEIARFGKKPPYDSEARPVIDVPAAVRAFEILVGVANAQEIPLIGAPSFTTSAERAEEAKSAKPKTKAKAPAGAGF